jgi:hypothetical protein
MLGVLLPATTSTSCYRRSRPRAAAPTGSHHFDLLQPETSPTICWK